MLDLNDLNEAQRKAVTYGGGPLLVLAGPGSGKTFTITKRILYLLDQGIPPEQLLVITFTREAAMSMQRRFQEMSGSFLPVNFGTFHSIFYHILQKSNIIKNHKLLTNSEKKKILLSILREYSRNAEGSRGEDLGEDAVAILSAISYYKNTLQLEKAAGKSPAEWQPVFSQLLDRYEKTVRARGRMDFDDMLCRCRDLLAGNADLLSSWQERFKYILIDEFQDINPVQYEVVKLLAGNHSSIFAVGDDDQAIYGFRGSEPECLRRFEKEYGASRLLLDINYRSHPRIVQASLAVIAENKDRFSKAIHAFREDGIRQYTNADNSVIDSGQKAHVHLRPFADREEQYDYLIRRLRTFLQEHKGKARRECAVLFRTNSHMQGLAVRLKALGIPYVMGERMQSIYEHFIVKDIMAYLALASGQWDRETLLRIVNKPSRYISREAVGSCGHSLQALISYYESQESSAAGKKSVLEKLHGFEKQLKSIGRLSPQLAVAYIQKAVGYGTYLRDTAGNTERLAEWNEMLEWLKADAARFSGVEKWQAAQAAHTKDLEQGKRSKTESTEKTDTGIRLMTVHGAKGLEFDTVIVAECNESVFPHGRLQTGAEIEEERRVFYVAMTRAKENLELLYLTGTKERPRLPSRFLNPLFTDNANQSSSTISSNSQLSRYSSKASATFSYSSSSSI